VTIESRDPDTGEVMRDVFELTPAPAQGEERRVLVELVTGIHPAAVEISFAAGVAVLDDAGREIIASFGPSGPAPFDDPNQQQTLFGP
jgi:hypothetical protein